MLEIKSLVRNVIQKAGYDIRRRGSFKEGILDPEIASISQFQYDGGDYRFLVANPKDVIQSRHVTGVFYEPEELSTIKEFYDPSRTFVDVGANVGNHAIYAGKGLGASRVVCFEPGQIQHCLLTVNLLLNDMAERTSVRKVAVSDGPGEVYMEADWADNLGGMTVSSRNRGELVRLTTLDAELLDEDVSFLKIDVEGLELKVLAGATETINRCRPTVLIEVRAENEAAFLKSLENLEYSVAARMTPHDDSFFNALIVPTE